MLKNGPFPSNRQFKKGTFFEKKFVGKVERIFFLTVRKYYNINIFAVSKCLELKRPFVLPPEKNSFPILWL